MKNRTHVIALTPGLNVPSSRFRIRTLIDILRSRGVVIDQHDAFYSSYPPPKKHLRLFWFFRELIFRFPDVFYSCRYDVVIFQRELISTIPTLERFMKRPAVLDVDDAIWLHRNGIAINYIARHVDHIVCGNSYIADYFSKFGKPITVIPTSVNTKKFKPKVNKASKKIIGWSGTSSGLKYLYDIEDAIFTILDNFSEWMLVVVSDQRPVFKHIPEDRVCYIPWSEEIEATSICDFDIGLMPLDDTPWSRGKCSYKMLLYMSCGVPVVVSNIGMNIDVLGHDFVGYGVSNSAEWFDAITLLIKDSDLRISAGINGRSVVEEYYSTEKIAEKWVDVLREVAGGVN